MTCAQDICGRVGVWKPANKSVVVRKADPGLIPMQLSKEADKSNAVLLFSVLWFSNGKGM